MPTVKQIFAKKDFPSFIKNHQVFDTIKTVKKIFPEIGLKNCEKIVKIDSIDDIKETARKLVNELRNYLLSNKYSMDCDFCFSTGDGGKIKSLVYDVSKVILNSISQSSDGKITLNLSQSINVENKAVFKKGEGLFRVYNKLAAMAEKQGRRMVSLEYFPQFKAFSSVNIPNNNKHIIRFSSDGINGLWDLATMSMRGIESCQSWDGEYAARLIGSIVDPFTGIIYLTSKNKDATEYGSKMTRRCLVRFVVNQKNKKPFIFIERMYPNYNKAVSDQFVAFIKEKTNNKFDIKTYDKDYVVSGSVCVVSGSVIPISKAVSELDYEDRSYRDSEIDYEDESEDGMDCYDLASEIIVPKIVSASRKIRFSEISDENMKDCFRDFRNNYGIRDELTYVFENDINERISDRDSDGLLNKHIKELHDNIKETITEVMDDFMFQRCVDTADNKKLIKQVSENAAEMIKPILAKRLTKLSLSKRSTKNAPIYLKYR